MLHRLLALAGLVVALFAFSGRHTASTQESPSFWVDAIGTPQYFAVLVKDAEESAKWYRTAFGLRELDRAEADDKSWTIVNLGNDQLVVEIIRDNRAQEVRRAFGFFKVGFRVPDVEAVAERVAGATGERPRIVESARHGVRILQMRDPDGNTIQLTSQLSGK